MQSTDTSLATTNISFLPRRINFSPTGRPRKMTVLKSRDLSLIFEVWGIFWEELKLKYAMFVQQQLDRVKEDDILTFSFLGFKFFAKFKIRSE